MPICTKCQSEMDEKARFCDVCGSELNVPINCPQCKSPVEPETKLCSNCRVPTSSPDPLFDEPPEPVIEPKEDSVLPTRKNNNMKIRVLVATILLAAGMGSVIYYVSCSLPDARYRQGMTFLEGQGVDQNYTQALAFLLPLAEAGNSKAQLQVARIYRDGGFGVQKDRYLAITWFKKAAAQGNIAAKKDLKRMNLSLSAAQTDNRVIILRNGTNSDTSHRRVVTKGNRATKKAPDRIRPVSERKTDAKQKETVKTVTEVEKYITMLQSSDVKIQRRGAKMLYRSTYRQNPGVLNTVNYLLLKGYNSNLQNRHHVDTMAWLCNILGESGSSRYKPTLEKISNESVNRKIKKYGLKNSRKLL